MYIQTSWYGKRFALRQCLGIPIMFDNSDLRFEQVMPPFDISIIGLQVP